ncbi:MAG: sugar phosphate isomerase/epimerase family protein [Terriglobales bacterium]
MRKAISTFVFVKSRLHSGMLDKLAHAGAEAIELFAARGHVDYTDRQQIRELANWFKHNGVPLNSLHAPMYSDYEWGRTGTPPINIVDRDKRRRVESLDEIKRALEVAEQIPFTYLVQHLGTAGEEFDEHKFEWALSSIEHLHAFARPLGVKVLLENIPNQMATPQKLAELINTLHIADLGVCFDFGHAHVMSSVEEAFAILKPHICSTHVHDNKRERDDHLFPGEGSIDWKEAMTLLRDAPHVPPVLLEIEGEGRKDIFDKYVESFSMLERAGEARKS